MWTDLIHAANHDKKGQHFTIYNIRFDNYKGNLVFFIFIFGTWTYIEVGRDRCCVKAGTKVGEARTSVASGLSGQGSGLSGPRVKLSTGIYNTRQCRPAADTGCIKQPAQFSLSCLRKASGAGS